MWSKITAFFLSIIMFFASLFGLTPKFNAIVYTDLSYGENERHVMDLYLPSENDGEVGLVLFIHGGAWIAGDKSGYDDEIEDVCQELGYAAASVNYRYLSEDISIHNIADDIDLALKKIKEIAAENGIAVNKVLLTGMSAGAHLALFYAYSRKSTAPITPVAVVSDCGPTDLSDDNYYFNSDLGLKSDLGSIESIANLLSLACGQNFTYETRGEAKQALLEASPIYYVSKDTVPTVINHGKMDTIVPYSNAAALAKKLDDFGIEHVLNSYPNSNHGLSDDPDNDKIANELFTEYTQKYLGIEKAPKCR